VSALDLSRWQFGITTVCHFIFVPLTIGLSILVACLQTAWLVNKDPVAPAGRARAGCGDFVGILGRAGPVCAMGLPLFLRFTQVRGLAMWLPR
jgi:Cytochrome bd terminal oxidase subunit I